MSHFNRHHVSRWTPGKYLGCDRDPREKVCVETVFHAIFRVMGKTNERSDGARYSCDMCVLKDGYVFRLIPRPRHLLPSIRSRFVVGKITRPHVHTQHHTHTPTHAHTNIQQASTSRIQGRPKRREVKKRPQKFDLETQLSLLFVRGSQVFHANKPPAPHTHTPQHTIQSPIKM